MGFNFRKSIKIGPARINLSKSGVGYSVGTKGLRISKSAKGKTRMTAKLAGTGISYSKNLSGKSKPKTNSKTRKTAAPKKPIAAAPHITDRAPVQKSWTMAAIMAVVGFAATGLISFIAVLVLYFIVGLFIPGDAPVWLNWLILCGIPAALAVLAGYLGFNTMKPEPESLPDPEQEIQPTDDLL